MHIEGLFYTYKAADLPGFADIAARARAACPVPAALQGRSFTNLPPDDPVAQLRRELDLPPDQVAFDERETAEARGKYGLVDGGAVAGPEVRSPVFAAPIATSVLNDLMVAVMTRFGTFCPMQGNFYYPPGGFRTWHTNRYDAPGWRMYVVDVDEPRRSYFRLLDPVTNDLITVWDEPGTVNFFCIDPAALLWHCIGNDATRRWSKGFVVPDDWHARLFG